MSIGRTLVIPDIHGCARTFRRLLHGKVKLERPDTLYLLGDLIDRYTDSRGVIETILDLQMDGFDIRPIRGNHEVLMLLALRSGVYEDLLDWLENGGCSTLRSYGVDLSSAIPMEHIRFLDSLPLYRVTDRYIFVHAGLDSSLDDPFSKAGEHAMLWDRSGKVDSEKVGGRKVIAGHTTRTLDDIRKSLSANFMRIDNGVCLSGVPGKGNLICVDLGTNQLFIQRNIDIAPADLY